MKILVVDRAGPVKYIPATTIRIVELLRYLKDTGNNIEFAVISERSIHAINLLSWSDVVIFSKHYSDTSYNIALHAKNSEKKIIYDIDDNIMAWPEDNPFRTDSKNYPPIISLADVVTVENERLKNSIQFLHDNFVIVPNGIYAERYQGKYDNNNIYKEKFYLFSAYISILKKFEGEFLQVLYNFHNKNDVRMKFYGEQVPQIMSLPFVDYIPMSTYETYMKSIITSGYMFAIVPLRGKEDPESYMYTKCKSPIKYITYGFAGIPAIYTDTLPFNAYVENYHTGILVDNTYASWYDAMDRLLKDNMLQKKIKKNAYCDVVENFHIRKSAYIYLKYVLSAIL
jgi:glycosyltransferase involved in cell wall biosynthesis